MKKQGFPPLIDEQTRILILGTMPGDESIQVEEYYANPKNQFWKLVYHIFNFGVSCSKYEDKTKLLLKNKIGLWDVLYKASRTGSMDAHIRYKECNDFKKLFDTYPNVQILVFNGKKSFEYFKSNFDLDQKREYFVLPSTSSANTTKTFEMKLREWKEVLIK